MITLIIILLAVGALAALAYPLIRQQGAPLEEVPDDEREGLVSRRNVTYSALKELEFDYQVGNLSPEEYRALDEKYKDKAVAVLKDLDKLGKGAGSTQAAGEPRAKGPDGPAAGSGPQRRPRGRGRRGGRVVLQVRVPCPKCGQPQPAGGRFCAHCGASLGGGG